MATTVVFNGVTYSIPAYNDTDYAQGSGNLSSYLIALAGGPFPYQSQSANPAQSGTIRLAHSDTIDWRNQANSGDLALGVNASDQLTFQGNTFATSPVSVANGGTGDTSLAAYSVLTGGTSSTNPVQTVSGTGIAGQALVSNGAGALPTWQNVAGSGTVNSGTATHLAYYATSTNAVSDANGHTISGTYPFSGAVSAASLRATAGDVFTGFNFTIDLGANQFFLNAAGGLSGSYHIAVPLAQGNAGDTLVNDGTGQMSWQQPFPLVAADPGSPTEGQVWYNTTSHLWKGFNGSAVRTFTTT